MRADPVLCACVALLLGATLAVAPLPALGGAAAILLVLGRRLGLSAVLVCCALFALSGWRAERAVTRYAAELAAARAALGGPQRCAARATVLRSPTVIRDTISYVAELREVQCERGALRGVLRARLYGGPEGSADALARGDVLEVVTQLAPAQLFRNLELPDPLPRAARTGVVVSGTALSAVIEGAGRWPGAWIDRARAHVRRRIFATFSPRAVPMARALVLGENDLSEEDDAAFKKSGLSHMLAVSGTHLVFAIVALVQALGFVLVRVEALAAGRDVRRQAAVVGAALALLYADFAGGSGSAWRAAWMLSAALLATAYGRKASGRRALGASLAIGACVDPLAAFDISFLLSAAATAGLIWIGQPIGRRCARIARAPLRYIAVGCAATVASMLPCAPLLALLGPELTLGGIVANLVAAPFGELVALPLCLAHALLAPWPALEQGVAVVASGALLVVKGVAHASAAATWLALPVPPPSAWQLALLGAAGPALLALRGRWRVIVVGCVCFGAWRLEGAARRAAQPRGELRVSALDVGQGDATLVDLPDGKLMLIDAGGFVGSPVDPGRSVIAPVLRERRRTRVDIVVLSHPHPDHFGGLKSALEHVEVGELWDTGQGEREGAGPVYAELLRWLRARGVRVLRPAELCGKPRHAGGARIDVLWPCPSFEPGLDANDNSLVVRIGYGARHVLLTGDSEAHAEAALVARYGSALRADLLKIGHHGSRTSSTQEFLAHVSPSVATISCGVRNRFGHPHADTLQKLELEAVLALRLDHTGGVLWRTRGAAVEVRTWAAP